VVHAIGYAVVAGRFLGRGRRQEHATPFGKSAPFSLLAAFIPLLNTKGCLLDQGCPYPSFGLYLGWFLFSFSPRIGWSKNNFLLGLIMSLPI